MSCVRTACLSIIWAKALWACTRLHPFPFWPRKVLPFLSPRPPISYIQLQLALSVGLMHTSMYEFLHGVAYTEAPCMPLIIKHCCSCTHCHFSIPTHRAFISSMRRTLIYNACFAIDCFLVEQPCPSAVPPMPAKCIYSLYACGQHVYTELKLGLKPKATLVAPQLYKKIRRLRLLLQPLFGLPC